MFWKFRRRCQTAFGDVRVFLLVLFWLEATLVAMTCFWPEVGGALFSCTLCSYGAVISFLIKFGRPD